jgi:hypothetical protein
MTIRTSFLGAIALGIAALLMADVAAAADAKPAQKSAQSGQPTGSVRHSRKRTARPPAAGTAAQQRQTRGTPQAATPRSGDDRARRGSSTPVTRADDRDQRRDSERGTRGRSVERDVRRSDDRHRAPLLHEYRGVRRPNVGHREIYDGHGSVRAYGKRPARGSVFLRPPERCEVVHHGPRRYFVYDDVYYVERPVLGEVRYVVVPPPVGVRVRRLPETAVAIQIGGFSFYYCDDTYYRVEYVDHGPEYVVTETPLGASILQLPEEHEPVVVQEVTYYRVGKVFYRPYFREGRVVYVHVQPPR